MTEVSLPWGKDQLQFSLPEDWELIQTANSSLRPAPDDWPDRLAVALGQPGSGLTLSKLLAARHGGRVVIIVEDLTRHSPLHQILDILLREIRYARVEDSQIEIFFATGMHPAMTPEQVREKLGPACDGLAWRCNPWQDKNAYVHVGTANGVEIAVDRGVAEADLRIIVSSVSPHLQAGFGGGWKMVLPGCAALETIRGLHRKGIGRNGAQLVGMDVLKNPMRLAIDAGGELLDAYKGKTFAVQYMLDDNDLPSAIATGEVLSAQRMLAKQSAVSCGVIVNEPCDVLITNAAPRDFDLWQSFKGIANTLWAARSGGVVICLTRCESGLNGMKPIKWPLSPEWTRRALRMLGAYNLASLVMRLVPQLAGDAGFFVRMATAALHRNPLFMVSPELAKQNVIFPGMRIFATPAEAFEAAGKLLGEGRQRVIVFPSGGTTYPLPTARSEQA